MVYNGVDLRQQNDAQLRERFYTIVPCGSTAMRDAVQDFVAHMETGAVAGDEFVLCIVTDGADNRSMRCTVAALRALIDAKNAAGWKIIMLGTDDIDVRGMGDQRGIGRAASLTIGRTQEETAVAFSNVCAGLQRVEGASGAGQCSQCYRW